MKEVEITCLCAPGLKIPDLGLDLKKGDVVYVPEAQARGSKDLARVRVGVGWRVVERCRERQEAPVPSQFPPQPPRAIPRVVRASASPAPASPDLESTFKRLLGPLVEQVAALRRESQQGSVIASAKVSTPGTVAPETPMFIPSNLMDTGLKAEIASVSEEQSGDSLNQASAALKALKRKR